VWGFSWVSWWETKNTGVLTIPVCIKIVRLDGVQAAILARMA
jgi:hypothetical protein